MIEKLPSREISLTLEQHILAMAGRGELTPTRIATLKGLFGAAKIDAIIQLATYPQTECKMCGTTFPGDFEEGKTDLCLGCDR